MAGGRPLHDWPGPTPGESCRAAAGHGYAHATQWPWLRWACTSKEFRRSTIEAASRAFGGAERDQLSARSSPCACGGVVLVGSLAGVLGRGPWSGSGRLPHVAAVNAPNVGRSAAAAARARLTIAWCASDPASVASAIRTSRHCRRSPMVATRRPRAHPPRWQRIGRGRLAHRGRSRARIESHPPQARASGRRYARRPRLDHRRHRTSAAQPCSSPKSRRTPPRTAARPKSLGSCRRRAMNQSPGPTRSAGPRID